MKTYDKIKLGEVDGESIYLSPPSWDCGWYWGFGYLGNKNCHYHVDGLKKIETYDFEKQVTRYEFVNLHDGFKRHFGESLIIRPSDLWCFVELFQSFYALKEAAEVLGRGGSHLSSNPCKDVIKNEQEVKRINELVLPVIFEQIYDILERNKDNETLYKSLVELNIEGDTGKVVDFMFEQSITTDDLKVIKGITDHDYEVIHTLYWRRFHAKNKI